MIINVRGANGSGKSTVVRRVLDRYRELGTAAPTMRPQTQRSREPRPLYYRCSAPGAQSVVLLGTYENPTGGCDTILDVATVFELAKTFADAGENVLYEGILAQHSSTRLLELHRAHPVDVIVLTTPLETCVASVKDRRAARGDDRPFDPVNVEKEYKSVLSSTRTLQASGARIVRLDREVAFTRVVSMLCVHEWAPPTDFAVVCGRCQTRRELTEDAVSEGKS